METVGGGEAGADEETRESTNPAKEAGQLSCELAASLAPTTLSRVDRY